MCCDLCSVQQYVEFTRPKDYTQKEWFISACCWWSSPGQRITHKRSGSSQLVAGGVHPAKGLHTKGVVHLSLLLVEFTRPKDYTQKEWFISACCWWSSPGQRITHKRSGSSQLVAGGVHPAKGLHTKGVVHLSLLLVEFTRPKDYTQKEWFISACCWWSSPGQRIIHKRSGSSQFVAGGVHPAKGLHTKGVVHLSLLLVEFTRPKDYTQKEWFISACCWWSSPGQRITHKRSGSSQLVASGVHPAKGLHTKGVVHLSLLLVEFTRPKDYTQKEWFISACCWWSSPGQRITHKRSGSSQLVAGGVHPAKNLLF